MSDWRQRATAVVPQTTPMALPGIDADPSQLGSIQPALNGLADGAQPAAQPVVTSDWRSRAAPVAATTSNWKSRATPVQSSAMSTAAKVVFPMVGIGDRLRADYAARDQEIQKSVDATAAGQQGQVQMGVQNALSNASKFTDTVGEAFGAIPVIGPAVTKGFDAATNLIGQGLASVPSEKFQNGVVDVGNLLRSDTPAGRNLRAAGQTVNLGGAAMGARAVGNSIENRPSVKKFMTDNRSGSQPPPAPPPTAADMAKIAGQDYDTAAHIGGKFSADQVANKFDSSLKQAMPKPLPNGSLTSEGQKFANSLKEFEGMFGKEFTLEDVDNLNKSFNQKINNHIDPRTGAPDTDGRMLMELQTKLRRSVTDIPDNAGNDALLNGRDAWHTKVMMQDLELVGDRASVAPGDKAKALQAGYRTLYNDKDRIASWPKEAVALLKEAAMPSATTKVLTATMPHLMSAIMGASGNVAGAAGAHLAALAGGTAAEAIAGSRGVAVQRALGDAMMKKRRDVNIPAPEYAPLPLQLEGKGAALTVDSMGNVSNATNPAHQVVDTQPRPIVGQPADQAPPTVAKQLMLAAPGKLSPLSMSDTQVGIAQKLMERSPAKGTDMSGGATRTPVSQVGKLEGSLKGIKSGQLRNMKDKLLSGELSQNKFVETSVKTFNLSTKQARDLAKEILTYGAKK